MKVMLWWVDIQYSTVSCGARDVWCWYSGSAGGAIMLVLVLVLVERLSFFFFNSHLSFHPSLFKLTTHFFLLASPLLKK